MDSYTRNTLLMLHQVKGQKWLDRLLSRLCVREEVTDYTKEDMMWYCTVCFQSRELKHCLEVGVTYQGTSKGKHGNDVTKQYDNKYRYTQCGTHRQLEEDLKEAERAGNGADSSLLLGSIEVWKCRKAR